MNDKPSYLRDVKEVAQAVFRGICSSEFVQIIYCALGVIFLFAILVSILFIPVIKQLIIEYAVLLIPYIIFAIFYIIIVIMPWIFYCGEKFKWDW